MNFFTTVLDTHNNLWLRFFLYCVCMYLGSVLGGWGTLGIPWILDLLIMFLVCPFLIIGLPVAMFVEWRPLRIVCYALSFGTCLTIAHWFPLLWQ